jgi:hypothetical protein
MILQHLKENSATALIQGPNRQAIQVQIGKAIIINNQYEKLESEQLQLGIGNKMISAHQGKMSAMKTLRTVRDYSTNAEGIQKWLKKLQQWALKGYKVIVTLRNLVTKQELVYHILDSNKSFVYEINETQFLELLSQKGIDFGRKGWSGVEEAINKGVPMGDIFELRVDVSGRGKQGQTALGAWAEENVKAESRRAIKNDAIYNYLLAKNKLPSSYKDSLYTEKGNPKHSRIFELYDQLTYSFKWDTDSSNTILKPKAGESHDSTGFFFSEQRRKDVDDFISSYIGANLHKDTSEFYQAGDTTQDQNVIIENKVRGATVSIRTIRNAIKDIAGLGAITSPSELKARFMQIFTSKGNTNALAAELQNAADKKAKEEIEKLFKS